MFEQQSPSDDAAAGTAVAPLTLPELHLLVARLAVTSGLVEDDGSCSDADRVDWISALERLRCAAGATQVHATAAFAVSQRATVARDQSWSAARFERVERSIAGQVGLARRCSPYRARRYVQHATTLRDDLPETLALYAAGDTSEERALAVAEETTHLEPGLRGVADVELAPRLGALGDRAARFEARRVVARLDPVGATRRARHARTRRNVTLRPESDAMARLSALLPAEQAIACMTALRTAADTARAAADPRERHHVMADTLVERLTGLATANGVDVEVNLVMSDQNLFGDRPAEQHHGACDQSTGPTTDQDDQVRARAAGQAADRTDATVPAPNNPAARARHGGRDEPAHLTGYGTLPAGIARDILDTAADAWVRRVHTDPVAGHLAGTDPRRRRFPREVRRALRLRDVHCRTPWCDAQIRHDDHVHPAAHGGPSTLTNAEGLCETCNYTKEAPGWRHQPDPGPHGASHAVTITTPTGHTYLSRPPDLPGRDHRHRQQRARGRPARAP